MGTASTISTLVIVFGFFAEFSVCQKTESTFTDVLTSLKDHQLTTSYSACDTVAILTQVLVREIEERVKLQEKSERSISQLKEQMENYRKDSAVAFSARLNAHARGLTRQQKITFGDAITNLGNAYNPGTGEFRCPVTGLYHFGVTVLGEPDDRIETELMAAGESKMKMYSGAVKYFGSGSNSVLLELNEGSIVYVRLHQSTGSKAHAVWSTFSGHLVQRTDQ